MQDRDDLDDGRQWITDSTVSRRQQEVVPDHRARRWIPATYGVTKFIMIRFSRVLFCHHNSIIHTNAPSFKDTV